MRTLVISLAIGLLVATMAAAADCTPAACSKALGCGDKNCRDCKVESGVRLVKRHVWVVECSEMCPRLPGRDCGRGRCKLDGCGQSCDAGYDASCENGCAKVDPCESLKDRKYVQPKCMKSRSIKKLVRKEILCEVPAFKCVPACGKPAACGGCGETGDAAEATPDSGAPEEAPPAPDEPSAPETAPEPPVVGTSYLEALKFDR